MNIRTLNIALVIGLASTLSLSAVATPGKMAQLDLNGDSYIDQSEFLSRANQKFSEMDTDANGAVTSEEREAYRTLKREERAQRRFERKDANSDGSISQEEDLEARAEREQKREAKRAERQEMRQARGEDGENRGPRDEKRERFNPDSNNDGVIDVAENTAAAEYAFTRMDKDGDGLLSQDEFKHKKRRGHRKHKRLGR